MEGFNEDLQSQILLLTKILQLNNNTNCLELSNRQQFGIWYFGY